MSQTIRIECQGATTIDYRDLVPFQGDLKSLSEENYEKLKSEIIVQGFSEPISVWIHDGRHYILNGHQRVRTLSQMESEGFDIPPIPINLIQAENITQAKRKVLALTAQYGEMSKDGLYEFMSLSGLEVDDITSSFRFPEVDLKSFKAEYFEDLPPEDEEKKPKVTTCPKCGESFVLKREQA